jgi:hypothetical protein
LSPRIHVRHFNASLPKKCLQCRRAATGEKTTAAAMIVEPPRSEDRAGASQVSAPSTRRPWLFVKFGAHEVLWADDLVTPHREDNRVQQPSDGAQPRARDPSMKGKRFIRADYSAHARCRVAGERMKPSNNVRITRGTKQRNGAELFGSANFNK